MFEILFWDPHVFSGCPPPGQGWATPAFLCPGPPTSWVGGSVDRWAGLPWGALARPWGQGGGMLRTPGSRWTACLGLGVLSGGRALRWALWHGVAYYSGWTEACTLCVPGPPYSLPLALVAFLLALVWLADLNARWADFLHLLDSMGR